MKRCPKFNEGGRVGSTRIRDPVGAPDTGTSGFLSASALSGNDLSPSAIRHAECLLSGAGVETLLLRGGVIMRPVRQVGISLIVGLLACGGTPTGNGNNNNNNNNQPNYPGDPGGTPSAAVTVNVNDDVFSPASVVVSVGGTVTFHWVGTNGHSVTPSGSTSFSPTSPIDYPPKDMVVTFSTPGTYHFRCIIHGANGSSDGYGGGSSPGTMVGTVTVR